MKVKYPFISMAEQFGDISSETKAFLSAKTVSAIYPKRKLLVEAGEQTSKIFIIKRGVLRSYISVDGKENTTWIAAESEVVVSSNIGTSESSAENIEAVTDCEVFYLTLNDIDYLCKEVPEASLMVRKILETRYRKMVEVVQLLKSNGITEKYQKFNAIYGESVPRIPLRVIASYLGIRIETLSRIRREYARGKAQI